MRAVSPSLIASFLFASAATAQTNVERAIQLQALAQQDRQEIVTAIRTISELRTVTANPDGSVKLAGPEAQVKLAEWVLKELDQTSGPGSSPSQVYEYPDPRGEGQVRVFYLPFAENVQSFQEAVTAIRTITDTRRIFQYNSRKAVVARGTAAQIALTEKLIEELAGRGNSKGHAASRSLEYTGDKDSAVRVFYTGYQENDRDFQQVTVALRTITEIRRAFTHAASRAIVVRGTPDQIDLASWLFDLVDQPASATGSPQERLVPGTQDVVRVIYLGSQLTEEGARVLANRIVTDTDLKGMRVGLHRNVMVVRGSVAQVLEVDRLSKN